MWFSWIIKTIPRSPRAFLALLVMLGSLALAFSGLTELFVPNGVNTGLVVTKVIVGLAIGLPATALFYLFQHTDERRRHDASELDILNKYQQAEERERVFKANKIATALPGHNDKKVS